MKKSLNVGVIGCPLSTSASLAIAMAKLDETREQAEPAEHIIVAPTEDPKMPFLDLNDKPERNAPFYMGLSKYRSRKRR